MRSVESVLDECQDLDLTYGLRRFVAVDDIFGIQRPWVKEFCHVFAHDPYHFRINCRANTLHYDLLPAMRRAGIECISFGFESGSEQVLNAISKNTVDLNTKAVHACHDAGIAVKAYLIWGFSEDDRQSMEATMQWIETAKPDSAQIATLVPLPGTPIYQSAIARGWTPQYEKLYHNGVQGKGGDQILPWWTEETLVLRDELLAWIEAFYQRPHPTVECPNRLSEAV
jgi:anaerobic magnesium-protoporphyrin IX monomethyl ester cyclase